MKKFCLSGIFLVLFYFSWAQDVMVQMLPGKWYSMSSVLPAVNDTFLMCREKPDNSYINWEFRENGSFYEQGIIELKPESDKYDPVFVMDRNVSSIWIFDNEKQTIELKDLKRKFRVAGCKDNILKLVRLE